MNAMYRIAVLALAAMLGACSTTTEREYESCIVGMSVLGGAVGAASSGAAVVAGTAVGAVAGGVICNPGPGGDSDGDGVTDANDDCPGTPAGVAVDARGCPRDSDGDGVADYRDDCPNTPAGVSVNSRGCPLDSDGDGVADYRDDCPGTPSGVAVDERGCPKAEEVLLTIRGLNFAFDSTELDAASRAALDEAVPVLRANARLRLDVVGHTDSTGPESYNQGLSERRAQAAIDYLVSRGVDGSQLNAVGRGESQPVASNDTRDGRAQNRRVEFVVR